jgi:hypothetical protein
MVHYIRTSLHAPAYESILKYIYDPPNSLENLIESVHKGVHLVLDAVKSVPSQIQFPTLPDPSPVEVAPDSQLTTRPMPCSLFIRLLHGSETLLPLGMSNIHPSRLPSTTPIGPSPTHFSGPRSQPLETLGALSSPESVKRKSPKRLHPPLSTLRTLRGARPTPTRPLRSKLSMPWVCPPHLLIPLAQPRVRYSKSR